MTLEEQIAAAEAKAQGTVDRFVDATHDLDLRQALVAQYRKELAAVNALKAAAPQPLN